MRTANITINTSALVHNLAYVQKQAPHSKVLAMVKANAYGHGVLACLPALTTANALGVATFAEALQIREAGWEKPIIMIEGAFSQAEWQQTQQLNISCVIHHQAQLDWALQSALQEASQSSPQLQQTIWLKVNTGMNRLGFSPEQIPDIAQQLSCAGYHIILTSHFANADEVDHPLNAQQYNTFDQLLRHLKQHINANIQGSLCNSAGIMHFPEYHYDWVRPGIMLYGSSPITGTSAQQLGLQAVMRFSTELMAIDNIPSQTPVGYGSRFIAPHPIKKGIISVGYGDGYPRVISEAGWVALQQDGNTYHCPIIGRVAMDMIAIDLSAVPHPQVGDSVILWGHTDTKLNETNAHGKHIVPHVDDVASWADTIGYELLCRLSNRPTRIRI
ncbi:alanine racemase [Psychrobacter sp. I-STPA6b]|uniref:alanine racemase n=1 Tax=Psychrobacter sp. I-STPA6b TaxID=2585718 RepID=UPI001D0C65FA|nr:alanine racemase [Psychrobacter sp. I-STPA6b]